MARSGSPVHWCVIDHDDSYTNNLVHLVARVTGRAPELIHFCDSRLDAAWLDSFDAVLLSPGPGSVHEPRDVGRTANAVAGSRVPVLGVCLGHQLLAHLAGARVEHAPVARHGHRSRLEHTGTGLFADIPQGCAVVRYHSHAVLDPVPTGVVVDARAEDGVIMAAHHWDRPWWGVQFHPESIASEHGHTLLDTFHRLSGGTVSVRTDHAPVHPAGASAADAINRPDDVAAPWSLTVAELPCPVPHPTPSSTSSHGADSTKDAQLSRWVERVATRICGEHEWSFWLDSARVDPDSARWSFVGFPGGPHGEVLVDRAGSVTASHPVSGREIPVAGSIHDVLRRRCAARAVPAWIDRAAGHVSGDPGMTWPPGFPLRGGYVGVFGYETGTRGLGLPAHARETPDAVFMAATRYLAIDHVASRAWLVAHHPGPIPDDDAARWLVAAAHEFAAHAPNPQDTVADTDTVGAAEVPPTDTAVPAAHERRLQDVGGLYPPRAAERVRDVEEGLRRRRRDYEEDVRRAQRLLRDGQSYEICLTNEFTAELDIDPVAAYLAQRRSNPAPYAALLRCGDVSVCSSSPEKFVSVSAHGVVESRPIKGTAARSAESRADRAAKRALAECAKTYAENLMIVDLVRHDLAEVCEVGSVRVPRLMGIDSYESVHQMVSTVQGHLRPDGHALDAVRACFPPGSMTGAPKRRTLELIDQLEGRARGLYSGALGYVSADGAAEFSVVIRTGVLHRGLVTVGAGGAVVLDSDPAAEYEEMLLKLRAALPEPWPWRPRRGRHHDQDGDGTATCLPVAAGSWGVSPTAP